MLAQHIRAVVVLGVLLTFQHGIGVEGLLDFLLQIQGRQLKQTDGLLQLRGHRQLLPHLKD